MGYFAAGAGVVVVVSFVMVSALWTSPRLQGTEIDADTPPRPNRLGSLLGVVGLALFSLVVIAGMADGTASALNVTPVLVLVGFSLVVPFLAPLVGDWWRWLSPWGLLSRRLNASVVERPDLVDRFEVVPATLSLFAFTWLELASPDSSDPRTLVVAALVLTVVFVAAGRVAGPESGLRLVDGFHTWFGMLGAIAPHDTTIAEGRPRGWFRILAAMPSWRGLSLLLVVMIGTLTYDGMSGTDWWIGVTGSVRNEMWFQTAALAGWVVVIGIAYLLASWFSATVAGGTPVALVADRFAHTLVPIALAYAVADYLTLVLFEGQILIAAASDPFGLGWDLFGTA
ncbi:MAG: hypothetical protein H0V96_01050, partial [Acidimicrobiia bacterium]|nr:hypothetical protein [Acidimicrobiia bacterium]